LKADQLLRERSYPIDVTATPAEVHPHVTAIDPTQARKRLRERRDSSLQHRFVFVATSEHADAPYAATLLRVRRDRPCHPRATEPCDELPPLYLHSITSSARSKIDCGTTSPSASAVLRFTAN
jgi:hypothetical protein